MGGRFLSILTDCGWQALLPGSAPGERIADYSQAGLDNVKWFHHVVLTGNPAREGQATMARSEIIAGLCELTADKPGLPMIFNGETPRYLGHVGVATWRAEGDSLLALHRVSATYLSRAFVLDKWHCVVAHN